MNGIIFIYFKTKIKEYRAQFNMKQDELAKQGDARRETIEEEE